jgi:hypothetical protein
MRCMSTQRCTRLLGMGGGAPDADAAGMHAPSPSFPAGAPSRRNIRLHARAGGAKFFLAQASQRHGNDS